MFGVADHEFAGRSSERMFVAECLRMTHPYFDVGPEVGRGESQV